MMKTFRASLLGTAASLAIAIGMAHGQASTGGAVGSPAKPVQANILTGDAQIGLQNPIYVANAEATDTTGTFTNATQTTSITATNADGFGQALISLHGTYAAASGLFFQTDDNGVTLYPVWCTPSDGTASGLGYTNLTNVSREYVCPVSGNDSVIVASSAVASGTVQIRIGLTTPSPGNVGTQSNNLTNINGVAASTGHGAADTGTLRVELPTDGSGKVGLNAGSAVVGKVGIDQTTPGTTNGVQLLTGSAVVGQYLIADKSLSGLPTITTATTGTVSLGSVANYNTATVQFFTSGGSTLAGYFSASIDGGTTFPSINAVGCSRNNNASTSNISLNSTTVVQTATLYCMQLPPNAILGFTITAQATGASYTLIATAGNSPSPPPNIFATTNGNVASGATDSGNPNKVGGVFNTTLPTFTNGQRGDLQISTRGGLYTILGDLNGLLATVSLGGSDAIAAAIGLVVQSRGSVFNGTNWDRQYSGAAAATAGGGLGAAAVEENGRTFSNITTATTTTVKSGKGNLHTLCLNTVAASGVVTVYDNTAGSGTKILTITNPLTLLAMGPLCGTYDIAFSTGLTVVTTGTQDITVSYR